MMGKYGFGKLGWVLGSCLIILALAGREEARGREGHQTAPGIWARQRCRRRFLTRGIKDCLGIKQDRPDLRCAGRSENPISVRPY